MDPFSVAASVVGLVSFCADVIGYLQGAKHAPKSAEKLSAQILSLQHVLKNLDTFLQGDAAKDERFERTSALIRSTEVCQCELQRLLEKLKNVNKSILQRATFPLNEKEINRSIDVLRGCAQTFQFSLTVDGW